MIKIAICDDEMHNINELTDLFTEYCIDKSVTFDVHKYDDGMNLLNQLEQKQSYDMIFLDIEMDGINGIKLAEKIRRLDMNVPIVYVTNYEEYWRKAYKVHAFQFIVKPVMKNELFKTLDDFIIQYRQLKELKVQLKCEESMEYVTQSDIYYFNIIKKKTVHMETVDRSYIVNENLSDIMSKLNANEFYMCHKSFIVNLRYVKRIQNKYDIIMTNGEFVPLAQSKRGEFLKKLTERYINILEGDAL